MRRTLKLLGVALVIVVVISEFVALCVLLLWCLVGVPSSVKAVFKLLYYANRFKIRGKVLDLRLNC